MYANLKVIVHLTIILVLCSSATCFTPCNVPCINPQATVVNTKNFFKLSGMSKVRPVEIVIYRCGNYTGCCRDFNKNSICSRKTYQMAEAEIILINENGIHRPETRYFQNDTECHCKSTDNNIK